ncbi:hypothetical protein [Falsiroseomonas oryzae]|uniref:hypothetical protein n=1 Tax=Falsiroseomonas oryzae TaxID=2766473 RepID=UPI0022EB9530|nr:hypothetical protein [Roseomonas sp. MO-31]
MSYGSSAPTLTQVNPHKVASFKEEVYAVGSIWVTAQVKEVECGPCCIALVLRQLRHPLAASTSLDKIRQFSQSFDGGYKPTATNVVGAQPSLLAMVGAKAKSESYSGSYMSNLVRVLNEKFYSGPTARKWAEGAYTGATATKQLKQFLKAGSPTEPRICQVKWDNGGSHFIVALGAEATKETTGADSGHRLYYFSDPYYGLQYIRIPHEDSGTRLTYQPVNRANNTWGSRGQFTTWVAYRQ